ncbi:MAG: hypothetical protein ACOC4Y_01850 [bacterium]
MTDINDYYNEKCHRCGTSVRVERVVVEFGGIISRDVVVIVCPWCRAANAVYKQNKRWRSMERAKERIRDEKAEEKKMSLF